MEKIKGFFDDFSFHARIMPVAVTLLPILTATIFKGFSTGDWSENAIAGAFALAGLTFLSRLVRNEGKKFESRMFDRLGAMPSTILLRFSDHRINHVTKKKYHQRINAVFGLSLPLSEGEETADDDAQYDSACTSLRNRANSNRESEPRVYQELKEYHFLRNLYGAKWTCVGGYSVLLVREIICIEQFNLKNAFLNPYPDYISCFVFLLFIAVMCFFVTAKPVEAWAFDYAKALVETCERI